jgi:hypothetical protein
METKVLVKLTRKGFQALKQVFPSSLTPYSEENLQSLRSQYGSQLQFLL